MIALASFLSSLDQLGRSVGRCAPGSGAIPGTTTARLARLRGSAARLVISTGVGHYAIEYGPCSCFRVQTLLTINAAAPNTISQPNQSPQAVYNDRSGTMNVCPTI